MLVPTVNWRSATTLPRELKLQRINDKIFIASTPRLAPRVPAPISLGTSNNFIFFINQFFPLTSIVNVLGETANLHLPL